MTFSRPLRSIIFTIIAAVAVYLAGNGSVSLWDRDEPRYAQTSRQMLQSGDWVVPRLLDEPREKKPVFIYWCQATAMAIFGENEFAARLPSVVFVGLTLVVLAAALWCGIDSRTAVWTTFIFATSALTIGAAKMAITDGVLILFIVIAQLCLYRIWIGRGTWPTAIACGAAVGLGLLTKGPVVPAVMVVTLAALAVMRLIDRQPFALPNISVAKIVAAMVVAVAVFAPWWYAMEQRLPGWTMQTLDAEVWQRAIKPQEGHSGPPGYYLLTIWLTYLPWSFLLPAAIVGAWRSRTSPPVRFALAAVIGPWVMFEVVRTKLPHYLLPAYPALAFLTADVLLRRNKPLKWAAGLGVGMMVVVGVVYALCLPRVQQLQTSKRVAEVLLQQGAIKSGDASMIDYKEPSLAFYQGGTIRPQRNNRFLEVTPPPQWPRWIVLTGEIWSQTPPQIQEQLDVVGTIHGWNYADRLRSVDVLVVRKRN